MRCILVTGPPPACTAGQVCTYMQAAGPSRAATLGPLPIKSPLLPAPCRSERRQPSKAAPAQAPESGKPRANGSPARRSGSGCSSAVGGRSAGSAAASPLPAAGVQHAGSALPPLVLPVPSQLLVPAWPAQGVAVQHGLPQQAQQADDWLLGQPLTAHDMQRVEQEAAAAQLSPADVGCLMAAPAGPASLPLPSQQPQRTEASRASHAAHLAPAGASPVPVQPLLQRQQQAACDDELTPACDDELTPAMWDSLLGDANSEQLFCTICWRSWAAMRGIQPMDRWPNVPPCPPATPAPHRSARPAAGRTGLTRQPVPA